MRTRWLGYLAAVGMTAFLPTLAAAATSAVDAPHDASFDSGECKNCHSMYTSSSSGAQDFSTGCISCHNNRHSGGVTGFPWFTDDQAVPGVGGNQHSWSGAAISAQFGARNPGPAAMSGRLVDGKLQCVVCHDAHRAGRDYAPDSRQTSIAVGVAVGPTGGPVSTGKMTLENPGIEAKAWRLKIQTVTAGGGTFAMTHNWGVPAPSVPTWLNWNGTAWVTGTEAGAGKPFTNDTSVQLDDTTVTVKFGAGAAVGNTWDFWVSYPFLRASNVASAMCYACHAERVMDHVRVSGADPSYPSNGQVLFSHPVNVAMNANGKGKDLAEPLEPTGVAQSAGDGNPTNDLVLDGGLVRCTTCHAIHNADSNSLSKDAR
jgi:hypothetical protein